MNIQKEPSVAKKDVSEMVSGMGMALRLLTSLEKKVVERGGNSAMLHFLTTSLGEENLDQIANLIVSLKWRVPKSIVMRLAKEISIRQNGETYAVSDELFFWEPALMELKIPYVRFANDNSGNGMNEWDEPLEQLQDQLSGKLLKSGMILIWDDMPHIVSSIGIHGGEPITDTDLSFPDIDFVHLTSIEYIDPET